MDVQGVIHHALRAERRTSRADKETMP
jgi:hypothetical protein